MIVRKTNLSILAVGIIAATVIGAGCNHVPPNLSPIGATAFRAGQVLVAIDTVGDVAVKAEASGLIQHHETLIVAGVCQKAGAAAGELGRALQAGEGQDTAKAKYVAIIRKALTELPDQLSQRGREILQPYINLALAALALIG